MIAKLTYDLVNSRVYGWYNCTLVEGLINQLGTGGGLTLFRGFDHSKNPQMSLSRSGCYMIFA